MDGRCVVRSAVLKGVTALPVEVEVVVTRGLVNFLVVGLADAAVQESRERVSSALKQAGFTMPANRIVVNLAPSSLRKNGSGFDLPIAVGILVATGQIVPEILKDNLFVGELSLAGEVRAVNGLLAYGACAKECGCNLVCAKRAEGYVPIEGVQACGIKNIRDLSQDGFSSIEIDSPDCSSEQLDYIDISGNEVAKRALQIAAAGNHGVLMIGPPGSGKTMLASRLPSILPPLDQQELLDCALVHSVAGENISTILERRRPFRSPHHSATSPSLIGGGSPIKPGEITLAHHGVLFLDELAEFKPSVLQQMRQPLEDGSISIARAEGIVTFPAKFMLVAASNPCPCGYYGDSGHSCECSPTKVHDYQSRIGGPLMDRIDIHINVQRVDPGDVIEAKKGRSSEELRVGVLDGIEYASWRCALYGIPKTSQETIEACHLDSRSKDVLEAAAKSKSMSGRGIVRTLALARTIADMAQAPSVSVEHLYEALALRNEK